MIKLNLFNYINVVLNIIFFTTLRDVYKIRFKNYMFVNKLFIEVLKFDDFNFSEFSKVAKIGQNYITAKNHLYGIFNN